MNTKQGGIMLNKMGRYLYLYLAFGLLLALFQSAPVIAGDLAISGLDIVALSGDKLQIQLQLNAAAPTPKVFKTDNPARIALDFSAVKNGLAKKMFPINQGAITSIYVAEAANRVRVVVNLLESTPYETQVQGNKVLLTLSSTRLSRPTQLPPAATPTAQVKRPAALNDNAGANNLVAALIPEQAVSGFDFKRGDKGEGRILVSLQNPNTIVNSKQEGGKVVVKLLNTRLPDNLARRLDVSEFATPVSFIDAIASNQETTVIISTQNDLYDYSLFQSEGLLTIEFRPLSNEEKEVLDKTRVKYIGERLSLNFQEIEIRSVIAILAEFTKQNVVAGDDVNGTITLKLDDVPWDEALDFIMMTKGLEKFESGTVTLIAPVGKIKDYKEQQQETAAVVERLDPLVTEYIKINYARAENFRNLLNGQDTGQFGSCSAKSSSGTASSGSLGSMTTGGQSGGASGGGASAGAGGGGGSTDSLKILSPRGTAIVDARTNTLIIRETSKRLEEAKSLIRKLDVPVRQVMIESRIVIANNSFVKNLGVKFGVAKQPMSIGGSEFAFGGRGTKGNTDALPNKDGRLGNLSDQLVDLSLANPYGALGMTLVRGADYVLNLELSALQDQGRGELVSNPRVMTSDRCSAKIKQGFEVPYTTGSSPTTPANIQFKEALLELNVLPQITPSGSISMSLNITKDEPDFTKVTGTTSIPSIVKREVDTTVQVMDGETVVLGGVFEGTRSNVVNSVPFFSDIPGIGFLFKKTSNNDDKKELLIFVTPKIVKDNAASN